VISVVAVDRMIRSVRAAMKPSIVVGDEGTNGGLWCSPVANTSRPTSSALSAMVTIAAMRSASVGVRPVVGSGVTSPTVKIPNCIVAPTVLPSCPPARTVTAYDNDSCTVNHLPRHTMGGCTRRPSGVRGADVGRIKAIVDAAYGHYGT